MIDEAKLAAIKERRFALGSEERATDIADLVAEVRRLREEIVEANGAIRFTSQALDTALSRLRALADDPRAVEAAVEAYTENVGHYDELIWMRMVLRAAVEAVVGKEKP